MYVEASSPRGNGDKARMYRSYTGLASGGSCLVFWYHMFGADIGRLNVYVVSQGKNTSWNMIGQQGNQWAKGQITIPGTSGNASAIYCNSSILFCKNVKRIGLMDLIKKPFVHLQMYVFKKDSLKHISS